ncbi:SDR family oxidoreductase [Teichococcus oryzae]|uniref:SDR family oxidoreductase n=1 Tax=Teichococcus oryzae TaxID=1608942 RepID=A0A5B2TEN3_9PROT|nr:SDR family oxidoreductase [Pseudoroseomonas oryzae]KAA2212931.1 SDR family oxidoreductase [Pseudoroseomonas oryzae]
MQLSLANRTALITGGSKGLGLAMARAFTEAGGKVAIVARGEADLREAASATGAVPVRADIATAEGCETAFREAAAALGRIDILVNNAGTSQRGAFPSVSDALWQQDLDLKLFAAIRLSRLAWAGMAERRWGRIINVLNTGAKAPPAEGAPTAVSRAAGMALTKVMANEGAPHGILVNALLVGIIESDQWVRRHAADPRGLSFEEWKQEAGRPVPLGRIGRAEEFAATALFLASEAGSYVAGTAINVDGGRSPVV